MTKRIGLYGGAFDPVHTGHLALANAAMTSLKLTQLVWIPTGNPSHPKHVLSPFEERYQTLSKIIEGTPPWTISDIEHRLDTPSYTSDTLDQLCTDPNAIYFTLIGADQAITLNTWHRLDHILSLSHIAIAPRNNIALPSGLANEFKPLWQNNVKQMNQPSGLLFPIAMKPVDVSSTRLR